MFWRDSHDSTVKVRESTNPLKPSRVDYSLAKSSTPNESRGYDILANRINKRWFRYDKHQGKQLIRETSTSRGTSAYNNQRRKIYEYAPWYYMDDLETKEFRDYYIGQGEYGKRYNYQNDTTLTRLINFQNVIDFQKNLNKIMMMRVMFATIHKMIYKAKQNTLKEMFGNSSSAGIIQDMMQQVDTYNNDTFSSFNYLQQEFENRVTNFNAAYMNMVEYYNTLAATAISVVFFIAA